MEVALTGERITSQEAVRIGVASKVVPAEKLMEEVLVLANKMASNSVVALRAIKESLNSAFESPLQEGLRNENRMFRILFSSEDSKEGVLAFNEKRKPQWKNK